MTTTPKLISDLFCNKILGNLQGTGEMGISVLVNLLTYVMMHVTSC